MQRQGSHLSLACRQDFKILWFILPARPAVMNGGNLSLFHPSNGVIRASIVILTLGQSQHLI